MGDASPGIAAPSPEAGSAALLPDAGELGRLILAYDWAASPLGPMEGWSPTLRTTFATILAARAEIVMFWGPDYVALYNDAYAPTIGDKHPRALGRPGHENWGELWNDLEPLLDRVRIHGESIGAKDRPFYIERQGYGEEVYFDISYSPVRHQDGSIGGVLCLVSETTERVRAARRAAEENARLATLFQQAPSFMAVLRQPGHVFEFANAAYQQLIGERSVVGLPVAEALPEVVEQGFVALLDQVVASGETYSGRNVPIVLRRTGGEPEQRYLDFIYQPIRDVHGAVTSVFVEGTDITDLRESEERFRSMADSAPALIWMCDETGALVFANRWHEETFGRPARELLGGGWHDILHPADAAAFCADFDAAFAARGPFGRDVRVIDRHGATRWLHSEARPRMQDGRFVGYVGCDVDVTEAHLASEALERGIAERTGELAATNRQLSAQIEERERVEATLRQMQRLEAVGQLTSGVAHDFNNLLTVVLGNVEMLQRLGADAGLDARALKRLDHVRAAAERGATLTAQLLAFSRRQRLEARPIDLNTTVVNMRDLIQSSMGGSVRLETKLAAQLWPALVDPTQIELIILNLAINARDAMQVGGLLTIETANVTLAEPARPEEPAAGDYIMIAVADSGTGMTPEVREKAFEPFFTTKEIGKGSGLGLAQVYGFVKQSGGGVGIDTAPGEGTTMRVYLPRAAERRRVPRPPASSGGAAASPDPGDRADGRHILVVDDDPAVREVTASVLRAMGAEVTEAGSGGAALDRLEERRGAFDAMVVDFAMPGMNGAEFVAAAHARWPSLPSLYVTGFADLTAIAHVSEERIVQKPFRGDELPRKLAMLLAKAAPGE